MIHRIVFDKGSQNWMSITDGTNLGRNIQPLVNMSFPSFGEVSKEETYAILVESGKPVKIGNMFDGSAGPISWHS